MTASAPRRCASSFSAAASSPGTQPASSPAARALHSRIRQPRRAKAEAFAARFGGQGAYGGYDAAIADPGVDAVVVAVPPKFHLDLTLQALAAGKHVLVEKPAFPRLDDYAPCAAARDRAGRAVLVGENDHYKPLARVACAGCWPTASIGEMVFAALHDASRTG